MEFPVFQVPYLGNGMMIALDAVLHVFLSHGVAIGLVAMIAMSEFIGWKRSSDQWENFAKQLLKPTIIIITGIGAVTGVGIWFITSALASRGIGNMLRVFFWPWFIEWIVFTAEVIVILIYYFLWDKWTGEKKKRHITLGFFYVLLASMSAFLITGILGFMLTSDGWPWDDSFWSAFFNPSFLPQLFLRLSLGFVLGATFATVYLFFSKRTRDFRAQALGLFGRVVLIGTVAWGLCTWWYFAIVPSAFKTHAVFAVLTSHLSQYTWWFWIVNAFAVVVILLFGFTAIGRSVGGSRLLVIPAMILALGLVTEYERVREFIRGPYLMPGYMYASQVLVKETPYLEEKGLLQTAYWYNTMQQAPNVDREGAYLFGQNCVTCHTIGGLNDIGDRLNGRSRDGIYVILGNTHNMVPFMPPFAGTDHERKILADFLYRISTGELQIGAPSRYLSITPEGSHE